MAAVRRLLPILPIAAAAHASSIANSCNMKLLSQTEAISVDEDLMATPGFSVDQVMNLFLQ